MECRGLSGSPKIHTMDPGRCGPLGTPGPLNGKIIGIPKLTIHGLFIGVDFISIPEFSQYLSDFVNKTCCVLHLESVGFIWMTISCRYAAPYVDDLGNFMKAFEIYSWLITEV